MKEGEIEITISGVLNGSQKKSKTEWELFYKGVGEFSYRGDLSGLEEAFRNFMTKQGEKIRKDPGHIMAFSHPSIDLRAREGRRWFGTFWQEMMEIDIKELQKIIEGLISSPYSKNFHFWRVD